jgi:hypothetical protein
MLLVLLTVHIEAKSLSPTRDVVQRASLRTIAKPKVFERVWNVAQSTDSRAF